MGRAITNQCISALLYDEIESYQDVITELGDYLIEHPGSVAALNNRAIAYWEIGESEKAEKDFAKALAFSPADPLPYKHYGMFLERSGNIEGALSKYAEGLKVAPRDAPLNRCMAFALVKSEKMNEAIIYFSQAIRSDRLFKHTYLERAKVYDSLGMWFRAFLDRLAAKWL